jgi:hypothetical protein
MKKKAKKLSTPPKPSLDIAGVSGSALIEIGKAAIEGDKIKVRELLAAGVNYRMAYLYVERFYNDNKASELIIKQGLCKCGAVATKWQPGPLCPNCSFQKAMSKIEYG